MKRTLGIIGVLLALAIISYTWFEFDRLNAPVDPRMLAKQSVLIVYAAFKHDDPELPLIIQEVWKDERKTNSPLIGLKLGKSHLPPNQTPEGSIVFLNSLNNLDLRTYVSVNNGSITIETNGQIMEMTLEQYKRNCGLSQ
jgi:hypothetical protein